MIRGGSRTAATSKMELFVIIVDGWFVIISTNHVLESKACSYIYVKQFSCFCSKLSTYWIFFFY